MKGSRNSTYFSPKAPKYRATLILSYFSWSIIILWQRLRKHSSEYRSQHKSWNYEMTFKPISVRQGQQIYYLTMLRSHVPLVILIFGRFNCKYPQFFTLFGITSFAKWLSMMGWSLHNPFQHRQSLWLAFNNKIQHPQQFPSSETRP